MRTVYARGDILRSEAELVVTSCGVCGSIFAIPDALERSCRRDSNQHFYCPSCGKQLVYTESETKKLKRELEAERARRVSLADQRDAALNEVEHQKARARGYKGAMVQTKKRAAKGVCPVAGCRRHFVDVQRHIASKHPGWDGE